MPFLAAIESGTLLDKEKIREEIILKRPHYGKKEHFRLGNMVRDYPISMTYAEMNRIAKRTF